MFYFGIFKTGTFGRSDPPPSFSGVNTFTHSSRDICGEIPYKSFDGFRLSRVSEMAVHSSILGFSPSSSSAPFVGPHRSSIKRVADVYRKLCTVTANRFVSGMKSMSPAAWQASSNGSIRSPFGLANTHSLFL
jgi:hypothetical protein